MASVMLDGATPESVALARLLRRFGTRIGLRVKPGRPLERSIATDLRELGVEVMSDVANWHDALVRWTALVVDLYTPPDDPLVRAARAAGLDVSGIADILVRTTLARTVGVTGSVGKSSTTALVAAMLSEAGETVHVPHDRLAGNLWPSHDLVDALPEMSRADWLVTELTSAHLEYATASPDVAVVTALSPDHIGWHGSLEQYYRAKGNILRFQRPEDVVVLNAEDAEVRRWLPESPARRVFCFGRAEPGLPAGAFLRDDRTIVWRDHGGDNVVCALDEVPSSGRTHPGNLVAATAAAGACGVPVRAMRHVLLAYEGMRQRYEVIAASEGVTVIDDGLAMTPRKAAAALERFSSQSVILISGGSVVQAEESLHQGSEERALVERWATLGSTCVKEAVLIGAGGQVLVEELRRQGWSGEAHGATDLAAACDLALARAVPGDTVLLLPVFFMPIDEVEKFAALVRDRLAAHIR
jgi:UDP-N-acetylmuramoylalanine--D-glutamate ligase